MAVKGKVSELELLKSLYFTFTAGVSLHEALREIGSRLKDDKLSDKCVTAADLMERQGTTFSDAIEQVDLFVNYAKILRLGQETGNLSYIMNEIVNAQYKIDKVVRKVKSSLYYPIVLMFISVLIGYGLTYVLSNLLKGFDTPAIRETTAYHIGSFITKYRGIIFPLYAVVLAGLLWMSLKNAYKLPVLKKFYNTFILGRAFKLFALGLSSGLTIKDSFTFSAQTISGRWKEIFLSLAEESDTRGMHDIVEDFEDFMDTDSFIVLKSSVNAGTIRNGFQMIGEKEIDRAFEQVETFAPLLNAFAFTFVAMQIVMVLTPVYMLIFKFMDSVGSKGGF